MTANNTILWDVRAMRARTCAGVSSVSCRFANYELSISVVGKENSALFARFFTFCPHIDAYIDEGER